MSTFYAAPNGAGNGSSPASPMTISGFMADGSKCAPGNALELADGTYQGPSNMLVAGSFSGTPGNPITIYAKNEGNVTLDGQGVRAPFRSNGADYFNCIGLNAHSSSADVYSITGSLGWLVQRCCGWDANDDNSNIFVINYGINNTFEDCAGWGIARKIWISYSNIGPNYFRRMWGKFSYSTQVGPKHCGSLTYHSYGTVFENCIGTWDQSAMSSSYTLQNNGTAYPQINQPVGGACTTVPSPYGVVQAGSPQTCLVNSKYVEQPIGVISMDADSTFPWSAITLYAALYRGQGMATDTDGNMYVSLVANNANNQPMNNVGTFWQLVGPYSQTNAAMYGCIAYQNATYSNLEPSRLFFAANNDNLTYKDCVAIIPNDPSFTSPTPTGATRQPMFLGNGFLHTNNSATNMTSFRGQAAASTYQGDWASRTNVVDATTPAALYQGVGESLYTTSQGARIANRYVNGTLTSTPLWPWPMSARIKAATLASGYTQEDIDATIQGFFGTYPAQVSNGVWFTS